MIELVKVKDKEEGQKKAHDILKKIVDQKTLLALSGGTSMDYRQILATTGNTDDKTDGTEIERILPSAIIVVDERYGKPFHEDSNEKLLRNQGVKKYADDNCIETHKILKGLSFKETGESYDKEVRELFRKFSKRVGVMGVGTNLHTAGIFPNSLAAHTPNYAVSEIVDDKFPRRISITLKALGEFSAFVVMMFGHAKESPLQVMLDERQNDMQKYPAIFYRKSKIKTFLVTDIKI